MAKKPAIQLDNRTGLGTACVAVIRSQDGLPWTGSVLETYNAAHLGSYENVTGEQGGSSYYEVTTWPAGLSAAGIYRVTFWRKAGATLVEGDEFLGSTTYEVLQPGPSNSTLPTDEPSRLRQLIGRIEDRLNDILADPRPNYSVNGITMAYGTMMQSLVDMREKLLNQLNSIPAEGWDTLDQDITNFGRDVASYLDDPS